MYAPFFGLKREPFSIAPDPRYLFMSERHREALAHLLYGVRAGGGFVLLTGEIGAGKTTVCRCFLEQVPKRCNVAYIFNPRLTVAELLRSICQEFHVPLPEPALVGAPAVTLTVKEYLDPLNDYLLKTHAVGQNNVLIIDEAQALSAEVLEQLRLLTNLETSERKLLQVILIGQPELREVLARPELEQLAQRVIARFHLGALTEDETAQYVAHRLAVSGLKRALPFTDEALALVHRLARGVPRRINLLCDRAMLGAYSAGQPRIGRTIVRQAAAEVFDEAPVSTLEAASSAGRDAAAAIGNPNAWPRGAILALGALIGAVAAGLLSWSLATRSAAPAQIGAAGLPPGAASTPAPSASASEANASGVASAAASGAVQASTAASTASPPDGGVALANPPASQAASAPAGAGAPAVIAPPDEATAWRTLAERWKLPAAPTDGEAEICRAARQKLVLCHRGRTSIAALRRLDRPALLWLTGTDGERVVMLDGFSGQEVRLRSGAVAEAQSIAELQAQWRGEFATLWRPPPGYAGAQVEGRETPAAKWVAERLGKLQRDLPERITAAEAAASDPLARDAAFEARVRLFQRSQGLREDGVLGPITLMQLNRVLGLDEPRLADAK
jgi:general secretion pathway protein A